MTANEAFTLPKAERICSKTLTERLFRGGESLSITAFPLRVVFLTVDRRDGEPQAQMLISVPKRCFKHAVRRNRVKRQVREAWRKNKHTLLLTLDSRPQQTVIMAFIWLDNRLHDSQRIEQRVTTLLARIGEKI